MKSFLPQVQLLVFNTSTKNKLTLQLRALDIAESPLDMNAPNWRLHALTGDLEGHWAIDVSGNWQLTFRFNENGDAEVVDYQDYH